MNLLAGLTPSVSAGSAEPQPAAAERRTVEAELREIESRYRLITEHMTDTIWLMDLNLRTTFASPSVTRMRGYSLEELRALPLEKQLAPRSLETVSKEIAQELTPEKLAQPDLNISRTLDLEFYRKDGSTFWSEVQVSLVRDDGGRPVGFLGVGHNITERKEAETERERNARQLEALSQMGPTVLASLSLEEVFAKLVDTIPPLLGAEGVSILLLEEDEFVFAAVSGASSQTLRGQRFPAAAGVAGEVLKGGRSVWVGDASGQAKIYRDIEQISRYHSQALLAVPIALRGRTIGVMEAVHTYPGAFSNGDLRVLEAAAAWAAIAIDNARKHEDTQQRWRESEAIAAIGRALNETLDLNRVFQLIVDSARKIMPLAERAVIHLLDEDKQSLLAVAVAGVVDGLGQSDFSMRVGKGIAGQVVAEGKLINSNDVRHDPRYLPSARPTPLRSLMVAPVRSGTRRLGTISVQSSVPNAFSADDEQRLTALSVQAALAINNARMFEEIRRRLEELTVLNTVATAGAEATSEDTLIERVTEVIGQTLRPDNYGVLLLDEGTGVLHFHASYHFGTPQNKLAVVPLGTGVIGQVAADGKPRRVADTSRVLEYLDLGSTIRTKLCVPLKVGDRILGVINAESVRAEAYSEADERLLVTLAGQLATAIEKVRLYSDLAQALKQEKSARARLVQSEKLAAMGRMVASVAHELNNPLQAIQNALYLVKQEPALGPQAREDLQVALTEADRMAGLISRLRDTYRPATFEQFRLEEINGILEEVAKLTATHMRHGNVTLVLEPGVNLPFVPGIRDQLKQVVLNLCLNAVEAMPEGGQLTVQTRYVPENEQILITFSDNGMGIDPEALPNIFDPFFTTKEGGTGLGLAITYDIIQQHNGRIEAESDLNRGTTFRVWLPVDKG